MRRAQRPPRRPRSSSRAAAAPSDRVPYRDLRATRGRISSVLSRRSVCLPCSEQVKRSAPYREVRKPIRIFPSVGAESAGLQRLEAGAGAALDAGGDQPVDIEAMAHQFEHAQFLLLRLAIDSRDVA